MEPVTVEIIATELDMGPIDQTYVITSSELAIIKKLREVPYGSIRVEKQAGKINRVVVEQSFMVS